MYVGGASREEPESAQKRDNKNEEIKQKRTPHGTRLPSTAILHRMNEGIQGRKAKEEKNFTSRMISCTLFFDCLAAVVSNGTVRRANVQTVYAHVSIPLLFACNTSIVYTQFRSIHTPLGQFETGKEVCTPEPHQPTDRQQTSNGVKELTPRAH